MNFALDDVSSSEDESSSMKNEGKETEKDANNEELKVTKKQRKMKPMNEDLLMSSDGMTRIYEEFPTACRFHGRGSEKEDLKRLMDAYKEWTYQLHPGLSSADVLLKCETLGGTQKLKYYLTDLRRQEQQRYLAEAFENSA